MEIIRVGSSLITNYSDYLSMKKRLKMYIDMKERCFSWTEGVIDTPFSKSISLSQIIDNMKECIKIFEEKYPKNN